MTAAVAANAGRRQTTGGFADRVTQVVASLPAGTCATYGEVAAEAGRPGAARAVGNLLARLDGLPWWRVVRADGTLPKGAVQEARLRAEGVAIIHGRVRPADRCAGGALPPPPGERT